MLQKNFAPKKYDTFTRKVNKLLDVLEHYEVNSPVKKICKLRKKIHKGNQNFCIRRNSLDTILSNSRRTHTTNSLKIHRTINYSTSADMNSAT